MVLSKTSKFLTEKTVNTRKDSNDGIPGNIAIYVTQQTMMLEVEAIVAEAVTKQYCSRYC